MDCSYFLLITIEAGNEGNMLVLNSSSSARGKTAIIFLFVRSQYFEHELQ